MITTDYIKEKIQTAMPGSMVEVEDQSQYHIEDEPTGAHIQVNITYSGFEGKTLLEQHQMIYQILQEEMKEKIHALKIITKVC
jgi:stress-induced morphogen